MTQYVWDRYGASSFRFWSCWYWTESTQPNVSGKLIKAALGEAHGNKAQAMILGVRRRLLYEKLTEFGVT